MYRATIAILAVCFGVLTCNAAQRCAAVPVTAIKTSWIARDITVHGHDEAIATLTLAGSPQDEDNQARAYWRARQIPAFGTGKDGVLTVQALDGQCLYLLSIMAPQGATPTTATYSAIDMGASVHGGGSFIKDVPMPGTTDVLDMYSHDATSVGHTSQFVLAGSPEKEITAYAGVLKGAGWSLSGNVVATGGGAPSASLTAVSGAQTLVASFYTERGKTQAVINVSSPR